MIGGRRITYALPAAVPRRAACPASGLGGRGPAREAASKPGREWKGLSPFNKEKTPSFTVNDQKGFYHDFSSGKYGDIFAFVMETEGLYVPRSRRAARRRCRRSPMPKVSPRGRGARERAPQDAARRHGVGREVLRGRRCRARRRQGARLSRRPRPRSLRRSSSSASAMRRPIASRSRSARASRACRCPTWSRPASRSRRRHSGAVRPFPRPRDVPDHRPARPGRRLRRARAR